MVEDLCFHLVDMVQNAVAAKARNIDISVRELERENNRGTFSISTVDIRQQVGDIHLSHPDVYGFLREYIRDNLEKLQK